MGVDTLKVRVVLEAQSPQDVSLAQMAASPENTRDI